MRRAEGGTSSSALTCCARLARVRFRWPVTREKPARAIPRGTAAALEGPAAGAWTCPADSAPAAALGPVRAAPPAVEEAADPVLEPIGRASCRERVFGYV